MTENGDKRKESTINGFPTIVCGNLLGELVVSGTLERGDSDSETQRHLHHCDEALTDERSFLHECRISVRLSEAAHDFLQGSPCSALAEFYVDS